MQPRDWDPSIADHLDIDTILEYVNTFTVVDEDFLVSGVHYYFSTRYGFPWSKIPPLIPESDYLDKFLVSEQLNVVLAFE